MAGSSPERSPTTSSRPAHEMPKLDVLHPGPVAIALYPARRQGHRRGATSIRRRSAWPTRWRTRSAGKIFGSHSTPARVLEWISGDERAATGGQSGGAGGGKERRPGRFRGTGRRLCPGPAPKRSGERFWTRPSLPPWFRGASGSSRVGENDYRALVDIGVGPVRGKFDASVTLSDLDPPQAATALGRAHRDRSARRAAAAG